MIKVAIIDTQGPQELSPGAAEHMPHCTFRGISPTKQAEQDPAHYHGEMCAHFVAQFTYPEPTEILFIQTFDKDAKPFGDNEWYFDELADFAPNAINRSWGQWDYDQITKKKLDLNWNNWATSYEHEVLRRLWDAGVYTVDVGAAGNSDENDADPDIDWPQALLAERDLGFVVGSARRDGVPSVFSGDGPGLTCLTWGERVWVWYDGEWRVVSGTSFSAPKFVGHIAKLGLPNYSVVEYVREHCTLPRGGQRGEHHNKWGMGNLEPYMQRVRSTMPLELLAPMGTSELDGASLAAFGRTGLIGLKAKAPRKARKPDSKKKESSKKKSK